MMTKKMTTMSKDKHDKKERSSNKTQNWILKNKKTTAYGGSGIAFQIWDAQPKQLIIRIQKRHRHAR
jgi:hypothetical protein